jgi:hypothetical protein
MALPPVAIFGQKYASILTITLRYAWPAVSDMGPTVATTTIRYPNAVLAPAQPHQNTSHKRCHWRLGALENVHEIQQGLPRRFELQSSPFFYNLTLSSTLFVFHLNIIPSLI